MSREPHFGRTRRGLAVHARVTDHLPAGTAYQRFNKRLALLVTQSVGTMTCAYIFAAFDCLALPTALRQGMYGIVQWTASFFLQLVLLSVIMVGQNLQAAASDARSAKTFEDVEAVREDIKTALDRLDTRTEGGIADVLAAVHASITMTGHVLDAVQPGHPDTAAAETLAAPEGGVP